MGLAVKNSSSKLTVKESGGGGSSVLAANNNSRALTTNHKPVKQLEIQVYTHRDNNFFVWMRTGSSPLDINRFRMNTRKGNTIIFFL